MDYNSLLAALKDFIPAISALLGVLVGSLVSLHVAKLNFRAQVQAKHRHEWVSELRETISEYQAFAPTTRPDPTEYVGDGKFQLTKQDFEYSRERLEKASILFNKIKLLLDPKDVQHSELLKAMDTLNHECFRQEGIRVAVMVEYQHKVTDLARQILAEENNRANEGK